jgi:uridine monophosphate synthetase
MLERELALALFDIGAFQLGEFKLKSGLMSPFYLDLRLLISYPDTLRLAVEIMAEMIRDISYDRLGAIPYAALPIGTGLSLRVNRPMIFPRKEQKDYGTSRAIEGKFQAGERILVIDDLITRGDSKLEAIAPLQAAGLVVKDIAVIVDRESGGVQSLAASGVKVHAALRLTQLLDILEEAGKLDSANRKSIDAWLAGTK